MFSSFYATYEGDGNPLDGLAKVGSGDHTLGKAIDSGKASVVQVAYENFPEATEKAAKILAPVGKALAVPYEMAEKVVTFLDTATGQIISRKWNSLDPYTQNLIKGFGKIISVTYLAKEAGNLLNINKELDKAKLAKINASNLNDAVRLKTELAFKDAGILDNNGRLTAKAIEGAQEVKLKDQSIRNPAIVSQLTKDGSNIQDWKKYSTPSVEMSNGESRRIHFYKNDRTGKIDYDTKDFKVKDEVGVF